MAKKGSDVDDPAKLKAVTDCTDVRYGHLRHSKNRGCTVFAKAIGRTSAFTSFCLLQAVQDNVLFAHFMSGTHKKRHCAAFSGEVGHTELNLTVFYSSDPLFSLLFLCI